MYLRLDLEERSQMWSKDLPNANPNVWETEELKVLEFRDCVARVTCRDVLGAHPDSKSHEDIHRVPECGPES